jgi:hypothetical protein
MKLFKYVVLLGLIFSFTIPLESCARKKCITYTSSTTTGNLSKSVKKKDNARKKKNKKKSGKMKVGKPMF